MQEEISIEQLLKATPQEKCKLCIQIIKGDVRIGGQDDKEK